MDLLKIAKGANFFMGCGSEISPDSLRDYSVQKPVIVEEKFDGIYCALVFQDSKAYLVSRTGALKENEQLRSLTKYLEDNFYVEDSVFVGELLFGSQSATKIARENGHHGIILHDVLALRGESLVGNTILIKSSNIKGLSVIERKQVLNDFFNERGKLNENFVKESDYAVAVYSAQIQSIFDKMKKEGKEGIILKDPDYRDFIPAGKSKAYTKVKVEKTMDYIITGYTETKSSSYAKKGYIGGIKGGLYIDGFIEDITVIGSMTENWRREFSENKHKYLGKVMECKGNEVFDSGALRHPSFVRLRDDKEPKDCIWEIK